MLNVVTWLRPRLINNFQHVNTAHEPGDRPLKPEVVGSSPGKLRSLRHKIPATSELEQWQDLFIYLLLFAEDVVVLAMTTEPEL